MIEYSGDLVSSLSRAKNDYMQYDNRRWSKAGLIKPDEKIFKYLKGRPLSPKNENWIKL